MSEVNFRGPGKNKATSPHFNQACTLVWGVIGLEQLSWTHVETEWERGVLHKRGERR